MVRWVVAGVRRPEPVASSREPRAPPATAWRGTSGRNTSPSPGGSASPQRWSRPSRA